MPSYWLYTWRDKRQNFVFHFLLSGSCWLAAQYWIGQWGPVSLCPSRLDHGAQVHLPWAHCRVTRFLPATSWCVDDNLNREVFRFNTAGRGSVTQMLLHQSCPWILTSQVSLTMLWAPEAYRGFILILWIKLEKKKKEPQLGLPPWNVEAPSSPGVLLCWTSISQPGLNPWAWGFLWPCQVICAQALMHYIRPAPFLLSWPAASLFPSSVLGSELSLAGCPLDNPQWR